MTLNQHMCEKLYWADLRSGEARAWLEGRGLRSLAGQPAVCWMTSEGVLQHKIAHLFGSLDCVTRRVPDLRRGLGVDLVVKLKDTRKGKYFIRVYPANIL